MSGTRASNRNLSGGRGRGVNKDRDKDTLVGKQKSKQMASWHKIMEHANDIEDLFGTADLSQISTDENMDLIMVAMVKLNKSVSSREKEVVDAVFDKDQGLITKMENAEQKINVLVDQVDEDSVRLVELEELTSSIHADMEFMKATVQRKN